MTNDSHHTPRDSSGNTKNPRVLLRDIDRAQAQWLEARKGKVSGSNIATICNQNPYCSPLELWAEWTGKKPSRSVYTPATRLGLHMEPLLAQLFRERNNVQIERTNALIQDAEYDWLVCSPDFQVCDSGVPVEIKTGSPRTAYKWANGGAPMSYLLQVTVQMRVLQKDHGFLTAFLGDIDAIQDVTVPYDTELWNLIQEHSLRFLECVKTDTPPNAGPNDANLIRSLVRREPGKTIAWSGDEERDVEFNLAMVREANRELERLREEVKTNEHKKKQSENNIKLALKDADSGTLSTGEVIKLVTVSVGEKVTKAYAYDRLIVPKRQGA